MRLSENARTVTGMAEYIEKWSIVNRLIDIENEFQQYKPFHGFEHAMYRKICEAEIAIGKTQAADVAPVVHGHWIIGVDNDDFDIKCSKCEWTDTFEVAGIAAVERIAKAMHYCPNCGAKMDEVSE